MDPRLQLKKARARESENGARGAKKVSFFPSSSLASRLKKWTERERERERDNKPRLFRS